jgi:hypothetical protein
LEGYKFNTGKKLNVFSCHKLKLYYFICSRAS